MISRQLIEQIKKEEKREITQDIDYFDQHLSLSFESREALAQAKPKTVSFSTNANN